MPTAKKPAPRAIFNIPESKRVHLAAQDYVKGRQPLWVYLRDNRAVREKNHYVIHSSERQHCCDQIFLDASAIPTHLATAKHLANKYQVQREQIFAEVDRMWLERINGQEQQVQEAKPTPIRKRAG